MRSDWVEEAEKNIQPERRQEKEKKKKIKPLARILKTEESCKRYRDLEAFQKAQKQKERRRRSAGVPGSHPTCRQGRTGSHVPSQVGAGGNRRRRSAEMPAGARLGLRRAAELGGSTVPSAVGLLLFQQCRRETIQGNDYYIILKEYGLERAEAAPVTSFSVTGRQDCTGTPSAGRGHATRVAQGLGRGRARRSRSPACPVPRSRVSQGLCFALSSGL